jgi:hypothetical protein
MRSTALLVAFVLCAACSGGGKDAAPAAATPAGADAAPAATPATPAAPAQLTLHIKDHKFVPAELDVPANAKFELLVVNDDPTPEEFESHEFNREKVVTGNSSITVPMGPLAPGRYAYFGEFHMDTAKGTLIAK